MKKDLRRRGLAFLTVVAAMVAFAPGAHAAITPSASTSTPTPLQAGARGDLDLDLKFAPSANAGAATICAPVVVVSYKRSGVCPGCAP